MDRAIFDGGKFAVKGGCKLQGKVRINGAKNSAVAIVPATLLASGPCIIRNLPNISDVKMSFKILTQMGAKIEILDCHSAKIDSTSVVKAKVPFELARKMRASYYYLGALLSRFGEAEVAMPGGCDFGVRPINLHLKGFGMLGADCKIENGIIKLSSNRLMGTKITFDVVSVGSTINIMLAAVKASGVTIIENAAKEPHIVDLANFLNSIGANIIGAGTNVIKIKGQKEFSSSDYSIIPDQIEAGTFMVMAAATGGSVLVENVIPKHLESVTTKLESMGVQIETYDNSLKIERNGPILSTDVTSQPYPGFPTDMQPQVTALLTFANGTSIVTEGIWDSRFKYVGELCRMGATISVDGKVAVVKGIGKLTGATVCAPDLRAGAALVIAALGAVGRTIIENAILLERGYENFVDKVKRLGADIKRIE